MSQEPKKGNQRISIRGHIMIVAALLAIPVYCHYLGKVKTWKLVVMGAGMLAAYSLVVRFQSRLLVLTIAGLVMGALPMWAASADVTGIVSWSLIFACALVAAGRANRKR